PARAARARSSIPEVIPHATHREEELRLLRVPLELLAQVANVHVDGPRIAVRRVAPQPLEQHRPAVHASGAARERGEDLELDVGQPDRFAADLDRALGEVDLEIALDERL